MTPRTERGSMSVELVLLTPILVGILLLTVAFGRVQSARADIDTASRSAARAASIERTAATARTAGQRAALSELDTAGYECRPLVVDVETSGFAAGATVTARVSCTVALSDVAGMGIPSSHTLTAQFSETVDRFRGTR